MATAGPPVLLADTLRKMPLYGMPRPGSHARYHKSPSQRLQLTGPEEDWPWQITKERCSRWHLTYLAYLERKCWAIQSPQVWKYTKKLQRRDCKSRSHQGGQEAAGPWWTSWAGWSWGSWRESRGIWLLERCLEPQAAEDWGAGTWNPERAQWGLGYSPGTGSFKACLH